MITSKIFQRSQRHEWFEPFNHSIPWMVRFYKRLDAIKPKQAVTKRYIIANQYWKKAE